MQVPATEAIKARLAAALAELHTEAGWCCHDSGLDGTGHFTRAVQLADAAADAYGIANAAWHAGVTLIHNGHPNDALKLFQLGQIRLGNGFASGKSIPATQLLSQAVFLRLRIRCHARGRSFSACSARAASAAYSRP